MANIGQFQLQSELGSNALGTLYRAVDTTTGQTVAVRLLKVGRLYDVSRESMDARLQRQRSVLTRLNHPRIARVLALDRCGDEALLVREFIDGPSVTVFLESRPNQGPAVAVAVALQVLDALAYAHRAAVVHQNLKPSNILVSDGKDIKLTDFGLAELAARNNDDTGLLVGTMEYMAPEQFRSGTVDERCDVHAVGAIFYEMLTRRSPFADPGGFAMANVIDKMPPPPSQTTPGLTSAFDVCIARALAKKPGDRLASAAKFREAIVQAYIQLTGREPPTDLSARASSEELAALANSAAPSDRPRTDAVATAGTTRGESSLRRPETRLGATGFWKQFAARISGIFWKSTGAQPPPVAPSAPPQTRGVAPTPSSRSGRVTETTIALAAETLKEFVGPVAIMLSRRFAAQASNQREYFELLARHIANPSARAQFLRRVTEHGRPDR